MFIESVGQWVSWALIEHFITFACTRCPVHKASESIQHLGRWWCGSHWFFGPLSLSSIADVRWFFESFYFHRGTLMFFFTLKSFHRDRNTTLWYKKEQEKKRVNYLKRTKPDMIKQSIGTRTVDEEVAPFATISSGRGEQICPTSLPEASEICSNSFYRENVSLNI